MDAKEIFFTRNGVRIGKCSDAGSASFLHFLPLPTLRLLISLSIPTSHLCDLSDQRVPVVGYLQMATPSVTSKAVSFLCSGSRIKCSYVLISVPNPRDLSNGLLPRMSGSGKIRMQACQHNVIEHQPPESILLYS